jgi:hypothetical protein
MTPFWSNLMALVVAFVGFPVHGTESHVAIGPSRGFTLGGTPGALTLVGLGDRSSEVALSGWDVVDTLVADEARVYVTASVRGAWVLAAIPVGGGAPTTLATNIAPQSSLEMSGSTLYFEAACDGPTSRCAMKLPTSGGTALPAD